MGLKDWTDVEWHTVTVGDGAATERLATGRTPNGNWDWHHDKIRNSEGTHGRSRADALREGAAEVRARYVPGR